MISLASHRHCENTRPLLRNLSDVLAVLLESCNKGCSLNSYLLDGIRYNLPVYRGRKENKETVTFILMMRKGVCE